MTISILAHDEKKGVYGGAAATGSLCVGGWVLRGHAESGMSASQGTAPSTLWGEGVLERMKGGVPADRAVAGIVADDAGAAHRQLAALDLKGGVAAYTGSDSIPSAGVRLGPGIVVAGNMLRSEAVLYAALEGYLTAMGDLADRLIAALRAAEAAGGDSRGLQSAALLVVSRTEPPLTLRIDRSDDPISALTDLLRAARTPPYADWLKVVPVLDEPYRAPRAMAAD